MPAKNMKNKKVKKVMCFGTFDLLHLGHLNYLQQAKKHGNYLITVIARDATKEDQGKKPVFSERARLELVSGLKTVDLAVLGNLNDHLKIIEEHNPSIVCLGYDHSQSKETLAKELATRGLFPKIKRMKSYKANKHKSTLLRNLILEML